MRFSPRQAEIIRLIAEGRSDKQIASQLGMSTRTVRTHLERVYLQRGLKSRASAVHAWLREQHERRATRPEDECPYERPFPDGFSDCPAYQLRAYISLDLSDRPLAPVRTCRHLGTKRLPQTEGRWYGACELGDAEARATWAERVGSDRLMKIEQLRLALSPLTGPFAYSLWLSKGRQLNARRANLDEAESVMEMRAAAVRFAADTRALLEKQQDLLDEIGLTIDALLELICVAIDRFIDEPTPEAMWHVPNEVLARFPPAMRRFLMPTEGETAAT